jgi:hypothetical protein
VTFRAAAQDLIAFGDRNAPQPRRRAVGRNPLALGRARREIPGVPDAIASQAPHGGGPPTD